MIVKKEVPLQRICGESKFLVYVKNGVVDRAFFTTPFPLRKFEDMMKGKNPLFVVNAIMRICGVCHAAHGIASAEAMEDAMGIAPPMNGRYLREAIGLLNRVQSHLIHLTMILPDLVKRDFLTSALNLLSKTDNVITKLGGGYTHPPNITIGGVENVPNEKTLARILETLDGLVEEYDAYKRTLLEEISSSEVYEYLRSFEFKPKFLASDLFYGDKYNVTLGKVEVIRYEEFHEELPELEFTPLAIALYNGEMVETGPRARLYEYRDYDNGTLWGLQEARLIEIELAYKRVRELLEKIEIGEPGKSDVLVYRSGKGVGVFEAPRGLLIHRVELDKNGRVKDYELIVPTMFLIPLIERVARNFKSEYAEIVPRIYDPCVPCCSAHVVKG